MANFTAKQKIEAVEFCIEGLRAARADPMAPEHETYRALKAVAADLRAAIPGARSHAAEIIGDRIERARRDGYRPGHMVAVAQEVISHWPAVLRALQNRGD